MDERRRHRILAGETRDRILGVLIATGRPIGVREVAIAVRRHPNSTREQLDQLVAAGLVLRSAAAASGRGRPAHQYAMAPGAADPQLAPGSESYRSLAAVLADQVAAVPGAGAASVAAGERWGSALAAGPVAEDDGAAVERLLGILGEAGFDPERPDPHGPVELRRCPFDAVAKAQPGIVCGVHLGMIRGTLATLGSTIDVDRLEPFVTPGTCLVHLASRRQAPGGETS